MAAVNYKRLSQKHLAAARQAGTRKAHAAPRTRVDELSARLRHLVRDEAARLKASTLQKKLHLWFKAADRDRNGYVNLDEFRSVVYRLRRANTEFTDTVQRHWLCTPATSTSTNANHCCADHHVTLAPQEMKLLFERFDTNKDGMLDYDEFVSFVSFDRNEMYRLPSHCALLKLMQLTHTLVCTTTIRRVVAGKLRAAIGSQRGQANYQRVFLKELHAFGRKRLDMKWLQRRLKSLGPAFSLTDGVSLQCSTAQQKAADLGVTEINSTLCRRCTLCCHILTRMAAEMWALTSLSSSWTAPPVTLCQHLGLSAVRLWQSTCRHTQLAATTLTRLAGSWCQAQGRSTPSTFGSVG